MLAGGDQEFGIQPTSVTLDGDASVEDMPPAYAGGSDKNFTEIAVLSPTRHF